MSSTTWTRDALLSSARSLRGVCWRVVEAQSRIATMKLSDTPDEQIAIERLIEETKPKIPPECAGLHFLLFTPFRYSPYPFNSRFRRAGSPDGVFYASEHTETAMAEKAFYTLLFYAESPGTPWPANPAELTAFSARFATRAALDLSRPPWAARRDTWIHRTDYTACLDLADACRAAGVELIRHESVRDPKPRFNVALLTCRAFGKFQEPVATQTWRLHLNRSGLRATCEFPSQSVSFGRDSFAADPRIAALDWER